MTNDRKKSQERIFSASEVAEFLFCAKAWQLKQQGVPAKGAALESGKEFHADHSASLVSAQHLRRLAIRVAVLAALLLVALAFVSRWRLR